MTDAPGAARLAPVSAGAPPGEEASLPGIRQRAPAMRSAAVVFVALFAAGALSAPDVPPSDDARFYVPAAAAYARWLERIVLLDATAWSQGAIDAAFSNNREHPPIGKFVMGGAWLLLHRWTGLLDELHAARLGVVGLWAAMAALLFATLRGRSLAAAIFATGALVTLPRLLYHGRAETLDVPVAAFTFAAALAAWRCLEAPSSKRAALATVLFALALGTKLNAPFALVGIVFYAALLAPPYIARRRLVLPPVPYVVLGMIFVSPLIVWGLWPWLWNDTLARLGDYLRFHADHYGILFLYQGEVYGERPAPWHAPFVMLGLTTPLPVLALALAGAARPAWMLLAHLPWVARRDLVPWGELRADPTLRLGLFALVQALVQLAALALPGVPVYGGEKLFLPALPFVALLAGLAFMAVERAAGARRGVVALTVVLLLLPGALGALAYRRAPLSYYNELAGGVRGAVEAGYERQYYDLGYREMADDLAALLPHGGGFAVLPNPKEYGPHLAYWQRQGWVSPDAQLVPPDRASVVVVTHERRWREYPEIAAQYRALPLLRSFAVAGVPLYSIYDAR